MEQMQTQMRFSNYELETIVIAILNNIANKKFIKNVQELFYTFTENSYIHDEDKCANVLLIRKLVDTAIERNIENKEILLNVVSFDGKFASKEEEILSNVFNGVVTEPELLALDKKISQLLKFATIEQRSDALINHINKIKSEDYDDLEYEINKSEEEILKIQKNLNDYKAAIEDSKNMVSLDSVDLLNRIGKIIEKENLPSSTIRTGIKKFNEMIGGGYKSGRVYCALAPMKNWKSGFLLTSALASKKYNNLKAKDPTKKPVTLYITLENSIDETIVRTIAYATSNDYEIKDKNVTEIAKILKATGVYSPNNDKDLGIEFIYRPNKTMTVGDINTLIDDYAKQGKEVVFLVIDYIKRIKPSVALKDLRLELGNIADELHVLALDREIPILTAMQLNRSAITELDQAGTELENKLAAFSKIGAGNVSESLDIIMNVDLAFTMVKMNDVKLDESGLVESIDKYLSFKLVATRYRTSDEDSFIHRFKENNDMSLDEDADDKVSRSIVNTNKLIQNKVTTNGIKTKGPRHVG